MPFLYLQFLYMILNSREITLIKEHNDEPSYGTLPVIGCQISHDPVVAPTGSTQFHDVPRCSTAPGLRLRIFGRSLKEVQEQLLLLSLAGQRHDGTGWNSMELDPGSGRASPSSTQLHLCLQIMRKMQNWTQKISTAKISVLLYNCFLAAEKPWIRPNF